MPFRTNFFNEKIAQPNTQLSEIDDEITDRYGAFPGIYNARLDTSADEQFKFGGSIGFDAVPDDDDLLIEEMAFDGFETREAAERWLTDTLEIPATSIEMNA